MDSTEMGFDGFFRQHYSRYVAYLIKLGFTRQEAEDATNEAMTEVYRRWSQVTNPIAYVYRTVLNQAVAERRRSDRGLDAASRAVSGDPRHLFDGVAYKDDHILLLDLLRRLPPNQRKVLALDLADLDVTTIAEILDVDPSTVRSHRRHALKALRKLACEQNPSLKDGEMP
ncbi:RNA polymerase sigma factor (sigma-70 family) [Catenulispora sp. GP43]|uniref:RNA polymerase sigma factor n=1 Tax=Catenulispora sp. GP43 TaxID=3156263 RepID=UPI003515059F